MMPMVISLKELELNQTKLEVFKDCKNKNSNFLKKGGPAHKIYSGDED